MGQLVPLHLGFNAALRTLKAACAKVGNGDGDEVGLWTS
jgi:hypothetical protein